MRNRGTLTKFIVNYPVAVILIILIATVVMGYGLTKIKVDTDPTDDIPDSIPAKKFYDEVGKIFPSNDFAFVALHSDKGIFTIKNLKLIKTLTEDIQKVAGVKKVISLYNAGIIRGTEEGLVIERPLQEKPVDRLSSEDIKIIKNKLIKNELTGSLISEDIKSTAIIATLKEGVDDEPVPRIIMSINKKSLDKNTQIPEEILKKLKNVEGTTTIPAVKAVLTDYKINLQKYDPKKYRCITLKLIHISSNQSDETLKKILLREFKNYYRRYGKPQWRYKINLKKDEINVFIPIKKGDTGKEYSKFINNLDLFRIPDPGKNMVKAFSNIFVPGSRSDTWKARVNYLIDLNPENKDYKNILLIPSEHVYIKEVITTIKKLFPDYEIKIKYSKSPIPSYYRIKTAVLLATGNDSGVDFYISGTKAASTLLDRLLMKDLSILFPVVILIITIILYLSFHTFRGVFLPLLTVILSVIWAMGLMGLLNQPLSMATMILPIILIAVGTAYTIHVINSYYHEMLNNNSRREAVLKTLYHVKKPILLAGITTMIGFGSLGISRISSLRMFGILSALGIASALLLSLSLAPAILVLASTPREKTLKRHSGGLYSRILKGLGSFTIKNKLTIVLISISIVAVSAVKIPEVRFETNTVNNFKKKTEIRQSTEFLNKNFSGITVMKIVVKAKNRGGIYDPYLLSKIDDLQNYLENLRLYRDRVIEKGNKNYSSGDAIVGGTQSIATFIKGINKALHNDNPEYYRIPPEKIKLPVKWETYRYFPGKKILVEYDSETGEIISKYIQGKDFTVKNGVIHLSYPDVLERIINIKNGKAYDIISGKDAVANYLLLYSNATDPEDLENFIDNNAETALINVFIKSTSSSVLKQLQEKTKDYIQREFPKDVKADVTGLSNLILTVLGLLVKTLVQSILMSLGIILVMITLLSRSVYEGILSIIPLGVALIVNFGVMGWLHLPLDMSTATIASIAIGIGIDYTIHFIEGYKKLYKKYGLEGAVVQTDVTTGKAILFNALAVAGGFCALLFSQIRGNVYMGLLMALIMLTSSIGSVTLLPALLCLLKPKFLEKEKSVPELEV